MRDINGFLMGHLLCFIKVTIRQSPSSFSTSLAARDLGGCKTQLNGAQNKTSIKKLTSSHLVAIFTGAPCVPVYVDSPTGLISPKLTAYNARIAIWGGGGHCKWFGTVAFIVNPLLIRTLHNLAPFIVDIP